MRKIFTFCLILSIGTAFAQPYNNEWIDFSKTYYKFKVTTDGLYRIPESVLAGAGLSAADAKDFQLFRNGVEIPLYTSVASGQFSATDYIEFWGQMNDGQADKPLYRNPAYQHTQKWSLQSDTSVYFLTVNPGFSTFRYNPQVNDTSTNVLPVDPYFMYTTGTYYKTQINPGQAVVLEQYIYSSSYDIGEFWSSGFVTQTYSGDPGSPLSDNQTNLYVYNGGPNANFKFGAAGCSDTLRNIQVLVNNALIKDTALNSFSDLVTNISVSSSSLNSASTPVQFINKSQAVTYSDRLVVSFYELTYPRQFNFGGQSNFTVSSLRKCLSVSDLFSEKFLNFNQGAGVPVLYDRSNGQRFAALVSGGILTFALPGTPSARNLVLVSEDPSNIQNITSLSSKRFIAYADPMLESREII